MAKDKGGRVPIAAAKKMKKLMADHFYELDEAAKTGSHKVAWCTSVGPAELLRGMGFKVYFPENHAAILGVTRAAATCIPAANAAGYSPEICSYLTSDWGAYLKGETPLSKAYEGIEAVPKADVLVYNTNQCRDVKDWLACYAREWTVPLIGIETYRGVGEVTETHIDGIAGQIEALVPTLEEVAGHRLDMDRFREALSQSRQCSELWKKVLDSAQAMPAPLTFFDGTIHMGPAVVARGTPEAVAYYAELLAELEARRRDGVAALPGERFRLYWEGMPIWGKLRELSTQLFELEANVVASTYCNSWIFTQLDPSEPFRSMARAYTELFIVRDDEYKERYIRQMLDDFTCDAIVFHDAKTCPNNSNNRYDMPRRLAQAKDVRSLTINGDLNDMRCVSDEQVRTQIEALIEELQESAK